MQTQKRTSLSTCSSTKQFQISHRQYYLLPILYRTRFRYNIPRKSKCLHISHVEQGEKCAKTAVALFSPLIIYDYLSNPPPFLSYIWYILQKYISWFFMLFIRTIHQILRANPVKFKFDITRNYPTFLRGEK